MMGRERRCLFCRPEDLWPLCEEDVGRNQVLQKLRRMSATARAEAVESRLPSEHQDFFEGQLAAPRAAAGAARRGGRAAVESLQCRWREALGARQAAVAPASAAAKKAYREKVLADRARARRRMGQPAGRVARGEAVENTTGLPPAKRRRAEDFERWCLFHSWGMCAGCGMMAPRDLTEHTLTKDQKVTQAAGSCWRCKAARHYPALSVADVPEALRGPGSGAGLVALGDRCGPGGAR